MRGSLTLDGPGLVGVENNIGHEGQLWSALTERLNEPQHAEVVDQVHGILRPLLASPPHTEALPNGCKVPMNRSMSTEKLPAGECFTLRGDYNAPPMLLLPYTR